MELYSFGSEAGHHVEKFGSDFILSPLMNPTDTSRTVCMHLPPGGMVGEHEAMSLQLFCVVSGEGWVSGGDGNRRPIKAQEAASWARGERHSAGTETGLTAIVLEGAFTIAARAID